MYNNLIENFKDELKINGYMDCHTHSINCFLQYLEKENYLLNDINNNIINKFLHYAHTNYSSSKYNDTIYVLKKFFEYLYTLEKISDEELSYIKNQKYLSVKEIETIQINKVDIQRVIKTLKRFSKKFSNLKVEPILWLIFYCGLRTTDFNYLKRKNFNLIDNEVTIENPQNKDTINRTVPIPKRLSELCSVYFLSEREEQNAFNISEGYIISILNKARRILPNKPTTITGIHEGAENYLTNKGVPQIIIDSAFGKKYTKEMINTGWQNFYKEEIADDLS